MFNDSSNAVISIVMPMYNAEKYVAQSLRSIISQTFQDFELIVVDDCSTDNSVEIVKSFAPQFAGKLNLIVREKNDGAPGIARNIALKNARGKYVMFMDSDDLIVSDALEMLYELAEKTQADVLHSEKYYTFVSEDESNAAKSTNDNTLKVSLRTYQAGSFVEQPTFETENLFERYFSFINRRFMWNVWNEFYNRDFLVKNNITFPKMPNNEDQIFVFNSIFHAKRYVRIPNVFYIYRLRDNSVSHGNLETLEEHFKKWLTVISVGVESISRIMNEIDFFVQNQQCQVGVIDFFTLDIFNVQILPYYKKYDIRELEPLVKKYLEGCPNLLSYLFHATVTYKIKISELMMDAK